MDVRQKIDIKNLTLDELTGLLDGLGKERFRARQLMQWIYRHGVTSFEAMTTLSKDFRRQLAAIA